MNKGFLNLIFTLTLLIFCSFDTEAAEYSAGFKLRYDYGKEIDPQSFSNYPNNLGLRVYRENLFTSDLTFDSLFFGDRLRFNLRMLDFRPSNTDIELFDLKKEFRLEDKIYTELNLSEWEFWVGDVYETFGKGLALNLFENRDLYFDSGLRGGKILCRSAKIRFKAIYGKSQEFYLVEEENVGGFNFEVLPLKNLQLGASLVHQEGLNYGKHFTPEVYAGWNYSPVSIYAEYAQNRGGEFLEKTGDGIFTSITAATLGLAAQLNYKFYHFGQNNPFTTSPICQPEFTTKLLSAHPHIPLNDNQVGYEVELSASPTEQLFCSLNFCQASQHKENSLLPELKQDYSPFWQLYLEGGYSAYSNLTTKLGLGWNEEARNNFWQEKLGALGEIIYSFNDFWSVSLLSERNWIDDIEFNEYYAENYWALTLGRTSYGGLTFSYENSSEESNVENNQWLSCELTLTIKTRHRLTIFYGQERGGLQCTSGVCRPVQPFEGFRIGYDGSI